MLLRDLPRKHLVKSRDGIPTVYLVSGVRSLVADNRVVAVPISRRHAGRSGMYAKDRAPMYRTHEMYALN